MDNVFDRMFYQTGELIGGVDKAGGSDIAGPLTAACVVLPKFEVHRDDLSIFNITASKDTPERFRKASVETVWQTALAIGIGEASPAEVDYFGKQVATSVAMFRAFRACRSTSTKKMVTPDFLLVDSVRCFETTVANKTEQGLDQKSLCVAAASLVAKVYRDDIMMKLHQEYPYYGCDRNKGYPCDQHYEGLDHHGVVVGIHRIKSWPFVKDHTGDDQFVGRRYRWKTTTEKKIMEVT